MAKVTKIVSKTKLFLPFSRMIRTSNWVRNKGFCYFFKVATSLFLDIAQDFSFGQCLTSSWAETSRKKIVTRSWTKIIFSILLSLSVHSNSLVISCKKPIANQDWHSKFTYLTLPSALPGLMGCYDYFIKFNIMTDETIKEEIILKIFGEQRRGNV